MLPSVPDCRPLRIPPMPRAPEAALHQVHRIGTLTKGCLLGGDGGEGFQTFCAAPYSLDNTVHQGLDHESFKLMGIISYKRVSVVSCTCVSFPGTFEKATRMFCQ